MSICRTTGLVLPVSRLAMVTADIHEGDGDPLNLRHTHRGQRDQRDGERAKLGEQGVFFCPRREEMSHNVLLTLKGYTPASLSLLQTVSVG